MADKKFLSWSYSTVQYSTVQYSTVSTKTSSLLLYNNCILSPKVYIR